jgi:hypothetical protein
MEPVSPDDTHWLEGPRIDFEAGAFATVARAPLASMTDFLVPQRGMRQLSW